MNGVTNRVTAIARVVDDHPLVREWFISEPTDQWKEWYHLNDEEVGLLYQYLGMVPEGEPTPTNMYSIPTEDAGKVLECLQESIHQSFDGWPDNQKVVIQAYLHDIAYAVSLIR